MNISLRPNNRYLPPPRRDPHTGKWFVTLPDSDQNDVIVIDVTLRHKDHFSDISGREIQRAGALYQYITSDSEYRMKFNPDEEVSKIVARLAEDAANLLLDWRRENHEHVRVAVSE